MGEGDRRQVTPGGVRPDLDVATTQLHTGDQDAAVPPSGTPEAFGPYRVVDTLGSGGMGVVYRARHVESGEAVAVKTVSRVHDRLLASLRREIRALARVRHPGIIRIVDQGLAERVPWFAMELLEGDTLRGHCESLWGPEFGYVGATTHLERPRRDESGRQIVPPPDAVLADGDRAELLTLLRRLCSALAFVHGEGIVHGDLKPENVFIRRDGTPVLVDFGLAEEWSALASREVLRDPGGFAGTVNYMAPERILGTSNDARADLYALGCILYECLTGRLPFLGRPEDVVAMQVKEQPVPPRELAPSMPPELGDLIMRLLSKNPADRVGHADDVAVILETHGAAPASADAQPPARGYLYRPDFVGREGQLRSIEDLLDSRAFYERARLVLVTGPSGAGKTRLVMELAERAQHHVVQVVTGECLPVARAPLSPLRPLLERVADRCHERGAVETERMLGPYARVLAAFEPSLATVPGIAAYAEPDVLSGRAAQGRVIDAMRHVLRAYSQSRALVLILDDVQWADGLTRSLLAAVAEEGGRDIRALVVGTCRAEELDGELEAILRSPSASAIDLGALDAGASRAMISGMLGNAEPPEGLVAYVAEKAAGNPFFVAEYLRAALGDGLLYRDQLGRWMTHEGGVAVPSLPQGIRELVMRRLGQVDAATRSLIEVASVIGRNIDWSVLSSVIPGDDDALLDSLNEAVRAQFLQQSAAGDLVFVHDRLREVSYGAVEPNRRRALHVRVGDAIERDHLARGAPAFWYPVLAHHFSQGGDRVRALAYQERAGEAALRAGSHREAASLLGDAIRTGGDGVEAGRRARWHRMLGDAQFGAGDLVASNQSCREALELVGVRAPGSSAGAIVQMVRHLGRRLVWAPELPRGDAGGSAGELGDAALAAQRLAEHAYFSVDAVPMLGASLLAVDLAERAGRPPQVARTYAMLALTFGLSRLSRRAGQYFELAREVAETTGDLPGKVFAGYAEAAYALGLGEWKTVELRGGEALALARRLGDPHEINVCETILGHLEYFRGEYEASAARYQRVAEIARQGESVQHHAWGLYARARALIELGRQAEAVGPIEQALALLRGGSDVASEIICYGMLARARSALGDPDGARRAADEASARIRRHTPNVFSVLAGYEGAARTYLDLWLLAPDDRELRRLARRSCRALSFFALLFPIGKPAAALCLGRYHWQAGRRRAARAQWRRGVRIADSMKMPRERRLAQEELDRHG